MLSTKQMQDEHMHDCTSVDSEWNCSVRACTASSSRDKDEEREEERGREVIVVGGS